MSDGDFTDLPVLERLGESVSSAAREAQRAADTARRGRGSRRLRRWPPRVLAVAALLVLSATAASAAATLLVLRGTVIPAPRATPPEQTPAAGSGRLAGFTVADPRGGSRPTRWTLRLATSRTGLLCSTVGQLVGGEFGIDGLDRRFRRLAPEAADACSVVRANASSLVGARIFDASRYADVRTVVSGVAGSLLRGVTVAAAGRTQRVAVHAGGTFLAVFAGLPEDLGLDVRLRFADGHVERHPFGIAPMVLPDPAGGRAWRIQSGQVSGDPTLCVSLRAARERLNAPSSPGACGSLGDNPLKRHGVFFAIRRLVPGTKPSYSSPFAGAWRSAPPRLLVWGAAGPDVKAITVRGPRGERRTGTFFRANGGFAYMFGPRVRPGQVTVTVRFHDGRTLVRDASTGLRPIPGVRRSGP